MSWPVSAEYVRALTEGELRPLLRVAVLQGGQEVAATDAISEYDLRTVGGNVQVYDRANVRRSLNGLDFVDETGQVVPISYGDLLDPTSGNELRVWRGLRLRDGTDELVPLITCDMQAADVDDSATGITVSIDGMDRSAAVARRAWRQPFVIEDGTAYEDAIRAIIEDRLTTVGALTFNFVATGQQLEDRLVLGGGGGKTSDPWKDAQNLAAGCGCELFFDPMGVPTLRLVADPSAQRSVWTFAPGEASIMLRGLKRSVDVDTLRNGAIVHSEAPWLLFPLISEVWDDDPLSPIRREAVGEWPEKVGDPLVWSQAQCDLAAQALFRKVRGVEEQVRWSWIPHAGLDASDLVTITNAEVLGGSVDVSIQSLTVPLAIDGASAGTTKRRRT